MRSAVVRQRAYFADAAFRKPAAKMQGEVFAAFDPRRRSSSAPRLPSWIEIESEGNARLSREPHDPNIEELAVTAWLPSNSISKPGVFEKTPSSL